MIVVVVKEDEVVDLNTKKNLVSFISSKIEWILQKLTDSQSHRSMNFAFLSCFLDFLFSLSFVFRVFLTLLSFFLLYKTSKLSFFLVVYTFKKPFLCVCLCLVKKMNVKQCDQENLKIKNMKWKMKKCVI